MATKGNKVLFHQGESTRFTPASANADTLYFLQDTHEFYLGGDRYGFGDLAIKFVDVGGNELAEADRAGKVVVGVNLTRANEDGTLKDGKETIVITLGTGVNAAAQTEINDALTAATAKSTVIEYTAPPKEGEEGYDSNKIYGDLDLKTSDKGNVQFTKDADGLSANVEIPEDQVLGVKAGDKVLKLGEGKMLETALNLTYDSANKKIHLFGLDTETPIASIDATDFIKDGMLQSAEIKMLNADHTAAGEGEVEYPWLVLTWNTDSGKGEDNITYLNLKEVITPYAAGDHIDITGNKISVKETLDTDTVNDADATLALDFGGSVEIKTAKYNKRGLVVGQKKNTITLPALTKTVDGNSTDTEAPTAAAVERRADKAQADAEATAAAALAAAKTDLEGKIATAKAEAISDAKPVWDTF